MGEFWLEVDPIRPAHRDRFGSRAVWRYFGGAAYRDSWRGSWAPLTEPHESLDLSILYGAAGLVYFHVGPNPRERGRKTRGPGRSTRYYSN